MLSGRTFNPKVAGSIPARPIFRLWVAFSCNLEQAQRPRGRSRRWLFGRKEVRSRLPDLTQSSNDTRTELRSGISLDFREGVDDRPTASVRTVGRDRVECVGD